MKRVCILLFVLVFSFSKTQAQAPVNDLCAGAITLTCGGTYSGTTSNATDDVLPAISCGSSGARSKGVWFKITPPNTQTITINTCVGTSWDTYMRVYRGTCTSLSACLAFNDDACSRNSSVTFEALSGVTYYILLTGYFSSSFGNYSIQTSCVNCAPPTSISSSNVTQNSAQVGFTGTGSYILEYGPSGFTPGSGVTAGSQGTLVQSVSNPYTITNLNAGTAYDLYYRKNCTAAGFGYSTNSSVVTVTTAPTNDECTNAIGNSAANTIFNTISATESFPAPDCIGNLVPSVKDIWFYFDATATGVATIRLNNVSASFDPIIEVFSGSCGALSSLQCKNSNSQGVAESLILTGLTAGVRYYFRVYGAVYTTGTFGVSVCPQALNLTASATQFCLADTIAITGSISTSPYVWYKDGIVIPGVSNSQIRVTQSGIYTATVTEGTCNYFSEEIVLEPNTETALIGGSGIYADGFSPVNIGIVNYVAEQEYLWKKEGNTVYGPPYGGNGGNQSYQFQMSSSNVAGQYFVEANRGTCPTLVSSPATVYYGGVQQLRIDSIKHDRVSISWQQFNNPAQYFEYFINQSPDPYTPGFTKKYTSYNFLTATGLTHSTQYYLHIHGGTKPYLSPTSNPSDFTFNFDWITLPFTTSNLPNINTCDSAVTINQFPIAASNIGATQSLAPSNCSGFVSTSAKDVWFKFIAEGNSAVIDVSTLNTSFDMSVELFQGNCSGLSSISCKDSTIGGQPEKLQVNTLIPGNEYYVRVYGWAGGEGNFNISICQQLKITASSSNRCSDGSVTISTNFPDYYTAWNFNGGPLQSQNLPTIQVYSDGNYQAFLYSGNCSSTSNSITITTPAFTSPQVATPISGVYLPNQTVVINVLNTVVGQNYRLRKIGSSNNVVPAITGNGSNQQFSFVMSAATAGIYYVESYLTLDCISKTSDIIIGYGGVEQLAITNCPYNEVQFSWTNFSNTNQRFRYIVNQTPQPVGTELITSLNQATVSNLVPGQLYYLHVSGSSMLGFNLNNTQFSNEWVSIPFRTSPIVVSQNNCVWMGDVDTNWNNAGNWFCGLLPQASSTVLITGGLARYPAVTTNTTVKSLTVETGANITVNQGVILQVLQ